MVIETINVIALGVLVAFALLMLVAYFVFRSEKEKRAAGISFIGFVFFVLAVVPVYLWSDVAVFFTIPLLVVLIVISMVLFIPASFFRKEAEPVPAGRIDERNTMFSRNELQPGKKRFDKYYEEFSDHRARDDVFRSNPGLLDKRSLFFNPLAFPMADAGFETVAAFHKLVKGEPKETIAYVDKERLDRFVREWLRREGVVSSGVTAMKDYHFYSIGGRGDRYGKQIGRKLPLGIAFTVEMAAEMVAAAPRSSIVMESSRQYLNAGKIAVQLAIFLRNLGYEARAHIDGNYEVVCPLVARDAGLGEIGRMGLLMTPELGPRVRIAVVTTNAPLKLDDRNYDPSVEDFCSKCLKCADACPVSAIPKDEKKEIKGVKRWQIDQEKCFTYWSYAGTDCGRCISVCPYSHPDNFLHNTIRFLIRNFPNFRKPAVMLDDFFYGRKPKPHKVPEWMDI
ncbi:MAG: 4Fe-4S dicluster domain-containing protein [Chlorobi bacterium]|nr:4Fe-4S dicluster domain-containing protein [Chlorobiota bacterium]